jgi:hypothetical protein
VISSMLQSLAARRPIADGGQTPFARSARRRIIGR